MVGDLIPENVVSTALHMDFINFASSCLHVQKCIHLQSSSLLNLILLLSTTI